MKALPKLSKAQQEAWARILEWYAQEDRKEAFISGKARRGVSPSAVPAGKNTLDALRDKGLLVYAPRKGYQPLHYAIHPDYLPASKPAAEPVADAVLPVDYFTPVDPIAASEPATDARPNTDEAQATHKTKDELDALKVNWMSDPCWDIEDTEGFEAYRDELRAFRLETEHEEAMQHNDILRMKMAELNCSKQTAEYVMSLEYRLRQIERRLEKLES